MPHHDPPTAEDESIPDSVDENATPNGQTAESDPEESSISAAAREFGVDEAELISEDEATVPRNEDGSLKPEPVHVEMLGGKIITKGIDPELHDEIVRPFLTDTDKPRITNAEMARLLDRHLVYPDLTDRPGCPSDHVSAEFVGKHLSNDQQTGYLIGMCEVGRQNDSARRLRGEIPDSERDLVLEFMRDPDVDVSDLQDRGNSESSRTKR